MGALQINLKILVRGVLNEKTVFTFSGTMVFFNTDVSNLPEAIAKPFAEIIRS